MSAKNHQTFRASFNAMQFLACCARSSLTLTRAVQRPVQVSPGRRKLAVARANCGILRRKSASSLSVSQSGLAGREGGRGSGRLR
ncbi:hypothetical protein [Escherichia coli]|nr:hypothetical protein [Escherichia coli]